jgi:methionyl-tRNA formyltransferase
VKKVALAHQLPILQPEKLKNETFLAELAAFNADLFVIVAFRMLPEVVWKMPPLGSLNLHGSLLPLYRGAAPINWALMNGETETGLSTFLLQHEIDTGDLLMTTKVEIDPKDDFGSLYARMATIGSKLLVATLTGLQAGELKGIPQSEEGILPHQARAPKLNAEIAQLNFDLPATALVNYIRGLSPLPGAYFVWGGEKIKVFKAKAVAAELEIRQVQVTNNQLLIGTIDGALSVLEVQFPGKKRLMIGEVLKGLRKWDGEVE